MATAEYSELITGVADYQPGEFYRRELDPLMRVVAKIAESIDVCIVDAYCHLDEDRAAGLGEYFAKALQEHFGGLVPVIGVAKNRFRETTHAIELLRGESERPLFVTAVGIDYQQAAERIETMHGRFRFPTLLKQVDQTCTATLTCFSQ